MTLSIALISPLQQVIPPVTYGGVERVVSIHAAELAHRGHRVSVFAASNSRIDGARVVSYGPVGALGGKRELLRLLLSRLTSEKFQIVHCFGRSTFLLPWALWSNSQLIETYACPLNGQTISRLDQWFERRISYTVPSVWMQHAFPKTSAPIAVVPNSLPAELYKAAFDVSADAPLAFLGRFDPCKGLHTAIEVALAAGRRIEIGGASFDSATREYEARIRNQWYENPLVHFLGPLNDRGKQALLQRAAGLLFPIDWEEPFGIVMIEAMACGTPVLAFGRGAVQEVVVHGLNGFVVEDVRSMVEAVGKLSSLDRVEVRRSFETRYSASAITDLYLRHYTAVLNRSPSN